jgi:DNA modification methylase
MNTLTLFNGDCLKIMKDLSANSIDLIICDLPYGCLSKQDIKLKTLPHRGNNKKDMTGCSWDIKIDLEPFWKEVKRIRRNEHSPTIHFCTTKFGYDLIKSNEKEFRYDLVWDKQRGVSFLSANKMPMRSHEMVYVFSKAGAYYERKDIKGDFPKSLVSKKVMERKTITGEMVPKIIKDNTGKRCVVSVINNINKYSNDRIVKQHPTEKPVELYKWLIERYCPSGGTVLDPTFGSCNSGRAAEALGRNYIGIEQDKDFFDKAVDSMGF